MTDGNSRDVDSAAIRQPIYPVYRATASYDENYDAEVVGESEMLGNIFNQVGKALERGASRVCIERTDKVVDARVPGH